MSQLFTVLALLQFFSSGTSEFLLDGKLMSTPLECARTCKEGAVPKRCYYNFTLEVYLVLNKACQLCTPKPDNNLKTECQCVLADGVEKSFYSINRMYPGPSIQVCKGDSIIVDVANKIEGSGVAIHWHGIWQTGTPHADGVPFVTQCPINDATMFRYQFTAGNEGTHFYHSHAGLQKFDGICGPLIVRVPKREDPHGNLYTEDRIDHVILITDWLHELADEKFPGRLSHETSQTPDAVLINGYGQSVIPWTGCMTGTPLAAFHVEANKTYRFRMINGFASVCPAMLTIEKHRMTVIGSDGVEIIPVKVDSIVSYSGERYDFTLTASEQGAFWIQVKAIGECQVESKIQQLGILRYRNDSSLPVSPRPTFDAPLAAGKILNPLDFSLCGNQNLAVCTHDLNNIQGVDGIQSVNTQFFAPFGVDYFLDPAPMFVPNTYHTILYAFDGVLISGSINSIAFLTPPSPLLTQMNDINKKDLCYGTSKPSSCKNQTICSCTHIYEVKLNAVVEMVLFDTTPVMNLSHPFHLHGGIFQVVAMGVVSAEVNSSQFLEMDRKGLIKRNLSTPPSKDTVIVPSNGYTIIRFKATNPGYWYFHCHFLYHTSIGMNLVIKIGNPELVLQVPPGFPKCGNFVPKIL